MRKKKTIRIKNPKLRKMRNNLRQILLEWGHRKLEELFEDRDILERDDQGKMKNTSELTKDEKARIEYITHQISEIRKIENVSICRCTVCGASDKDMTYNPVRKEWFCVDCYKLNQDFHKDTDEAYLYP